MADLTQRKWSGKSSAGSLANRGLRFLMKCIHIRVAYVVLYFIIPFYMLFARKGYLSIFRFFRLRFGQSRWQAFVSTYKNHYIFGQTLLDKFAVFAGKYNFLKFDVDGQSYVDFAMADSKGCLFASAHVGNFEIAGYFLNGGKVINSLIYGGEQRVVQANRDRVFGSQSVNLIPIADDMSHIFFLSQAASRNEVISMHCDRYFSGSKCVTVDFMGVATNFALGVFHLASRYELNSLAVFVVKERWNRYRAIVRPMVGVTASELAASYAVLLEQVVKEYPLQWFNFYDFFDGK